MQSATIRRFAPLQLAAALLIATGVGGGVLALGMTDNLPGQGSSTTRISSLGDTRPIVSGVRPADQGEGRIGPGASLDLARPVVKGSRSVGQGEGFIGPGATFDAARPMVKGGRSLGQGEGLIGAGATLDVARPMVKGDRSLGQGEGFIGPGAPSAPRGARAIETDRADGIGLTADDVGATNEAAPSAADYVLDPHGTGITER